MRLLGQPPARTAIGLVNLVVCGVGRHDEWYAIEYHLDEGIMAAITATDARKGLFGIIQEVNDDHTAVEVVSRHGNVVIMSKDDYDAMTETAYLLRNPANAERLLEAIERARRGEFEQHDLLHA
jgi:antitoxin YefM